jgi:dihydroorotase
LEFESLMPHFAKPVDLTQPPKPTVLINARLIDPASGRDEHGGVLVEDGVIVKVGPELRRNAPSGYKVIDCQGQIVSPGLVDMQVFTGEPGAEHRETLHTASRAAAAGGVTTMIVMPDTNPVIDQVALVDFTLRRARDNAIVHIHPMAAMTKGLEGNELTEIGLLKRAGAIAFSNGKQSIMDTRVMQLVLQYSRDFDALIAHFAEDHFLAGNASMNAGELATRLGLSGAHKVAETIILDRDLHLVEITNARYHAPTLSCPESVASIKQARDKGLKVTCGVSINHLALNENDVVAYRTFYKVRPPLRTETDRMAMVRAVDAGDIDVIVSSHDPQDADTKRRPFAEAADGAVGLETMLSAALRLHYNDDADLMMLLRAMTSGPADLLGLKCGRLAVGAPADLIQFDPHAPWVVNRDELSSRSKNSPFDESKMQGRVLRTMVAGRIVYSYAQDLEN